MNSCELIEMLVPEEAEKLCSSFRSVTTIQDLANLLDISYRKHLVYYLYRVPKGQRYCEFQLPKRRGNGTRTISGAATNLKFIQQRLNTVLQAVYTPRRSVHGFTLFRGIVTNAEKHVRKKCVLGIDLENFFGSINFGRVRGMFLAKPYEMPPSVATILAQICCHDNSLPQGAPTSPVISNMICSRLDKQLRDVAASHGCYYTRYADDITLSTNRNPFPADLAFVNSETGIHTVQVGEKLRGIIQASGFRINPSKVRLSTRSQRQDVTGLVVNQFVNVDRRYVRNLRALLHACSKHGTEALQHYFIEKYHVKSRLPQKAVPSVVQVAYGRIQHLGAVRGWDDEVYKRFREQFNILSPCKIRVPSDPWITLLQRSCWVIEDFDEVSQGTAFFLEGYGLITNYHCLRKDPFIYHPGNPSKRYRVMVTHSHDVVDLAVLTPLEPMPDVHELPPAQFASEVQHGDSVTLVGYPDHAPGKEISIKSGEVQGFTTKSTIRRFNISAAIVVGNSGGPVLNRSKRVVGIAVTGVATLEDTSHATTEHGVIPIGALRHLIPQGERLQGHQVHSHG
ncbi:MAG: trypsin-like peptidase domain-containing protein [Rhodoplanes sp.]